MVLFKLLSGLLDAPYLPLVQSAGTVKLASTTVLYKKLASIMPCGKQA